MKKKNDLSAFKVATKEVLTTPQTSEPAKKTVRKKRGQPEKPAAQKVAKYIQIGLTQAEFDALAERAGMVPISKFMRQELKDAGVI